MDESERERLESILEAITIAQNPEQVTQEVDDLLALVEQARAVENAGEEAKLTRLRQVLEEEGFFRNPEQRLLIFTEFKDTLDYLAGNKAAGITGKLEDWGFRVGVIHGGMRPGSRDETGTRLY